MVLSCERVDRAVEQVEPPDFAQSYELKISLAMFLLHRQV